MTRPCFSVLHPGMLTLVEDLGRWGYQHYGVPVAGAMDEWSLVMANRLVGNPNDAAGLELTVVGPRLRVVKDCVIAITGADLDPRLNGQPVSMWESLRVSAGDVLAFGPTRAGCRGYLAVQGGIAVEPVFGSRSTDLRTRLGGLNGRPVAKGDELQRYESGAPYVHRRLAARYRPTYQSPYRLRTVRGPQAEVFSPEARQEFYASRFGVSASSDRMGVRLEGVNLPYGDVEIISEGIPPGSIQVPRSGLPIILTVERQSTGGYPKIASVVTPDLGLLGQLKPGDQVQFSELDLETARRLTTRFLRAIRGLSEVVSE